MKALKHLATLKRMIDTLAASAPESASERPRPLAALAECSRRLDHAEARIVFFGAFKAGKTSLLNAMIGAPLLPSRANRATGVVTRIGHADRPAASVLRRNGQPGLIESSISLDDIGRHILITVANGQSAPPAGVEEVKLQLPQPAFKAGCWLVDTPGLMDSEELTTRTFAALERADLAVMVLSADRLLSVREREAIKRVQTLLNGNLVFVVNRLNLMGEAEQAEMLDTTRHVLQTAGNSLVGQPRLFATREEVLLRVQQPKAAPPSGRDGVEELSQWLSQLFDSPERRRLVLLARLGVLRHHLADVKTVFQARLAEAEIRAAQCRQHDEENHQAALREFDQAISAARWQVIQFRNRLEEFGQQFINDCVAQTRQLVNTAPDWQARLSEPLAQACSNYQSNLQTITSELNHLKLLWPNFAPAAQSHGIVIAEDGSAKAGALLGGAIGAIFTFGLDGGLIGAGIGGFLSNLLFGVDVKQETIRNAERAAQACLGRLRAAAEDYLNQIENCLIGHGETGKPILSLSAAAVAAQRKAEEYSRFLQSCAEAEGLVEIIKKEIAQ
ncbi:MAG: dynamin family protein [Blastocatellia bacterium]